MVFRRCGPGIRIFIVFVIFSIFCLDADICYDGFAAFDKTICNELNLTMVNIMVDHPMSFKDSICDPPQKYILLMPDEQAGNADVRAASVLSVGDTRGHI